MKKTEYSDMPQEQLVSWLTELRAHEEQLNQEDAKLNGQLAELQRQEQAYVERYKKAASESEEERQLRELREEIQKEKRKCRGVKVAFFLKLSFLIMGVGAFFGYNIVMKSMEYEGSPGHKENEDRYQAVMSNKEVAYQNKKDELENKYNNLIKEKESDYLAQKENLEADIWNYKLSNLGVGSETEMREYLNSLPIRSTKFIETIYNDAGIPYYVCREKYDLNYYGNIDTGTNIIYPGAIIKGDTLFSDNYTVIPVKCGSAELVCNIQGSPILTVNEVNYGNIQRELDVYQALAKNERYKNTNFQSVIVHSETQVNASLGISGKLSGTTVLGPGSVSASASVGKGYQEDKTNLLLIVDQVAYTVSVQPRQDNLDFFAEGADLSKLGSYAPAYISSVNYGRKIFIMISAEATEEELQMAIEVGLQTQLPPGALGMADAEVSAELKATYDKVVKNSKTTCNITVIGGNAEASTFPSLSVSNCMAKLSELLAEGEGNGIVNPVPISYKMNYIHTNEPVPCVQIAKEVKFLKDETDIIQLQWKDKQSGTVSCEINSVGESTFVVGPNVLSIEEGKTIGNNVVYVVAKKNAECMVCINKKELKKKLFGGTEWKPVTKTVNIYETGLWVSKLSDYGISMSVCSELPDME